MENFEDCWKEPAIKYVLFLKEEKSCLTSSSPITNVQHGKTLKTYNFSNAEIGKFGEAMKTNLLYSRQIFSGFLNIFFTMINKLY